MSRRWWQGWVVALALMAGGWLVPLPAAAQQCNSSGFGIDFGTLSQGGSADATASIPYRCQSNQSTTYYTVCLYVPEGPSGSTSDMSGVNPRKMTDYNGHTLYYTLYSDAAHTQVIGPQGSGYPVYTTSFSVPGGWSQPDRTLSMYGHAGPVAAGTPAGSYQAQIGNITLQYAWSNTSTPGSCQQGANTGSTTVGFSGAKATVSNACIVSIGSATDLDFGSTASLSSAMDSSATITLNCPSNTQWKLGLNNGLHALGTQRRMAGSSGDYVNYELYRDAGRTQRWGNDTAGGTDTVNGPLGSTGAQVIPVYGRVPAQSLPAAGAYTDTVTVTLTY